MSVPEHLADVVDLDLDALSPAERAARARQAWRQSGGRLSGADLARRFGRSERWGRDQIAAAKAEDDRAAAATGNGSAPAPAAATAAAGSAVLPANGSRPAAAPAADRQPGAATPPAAPLPPARPKRQERQPATAAPEEPWHRRLPLVAASLGVLATAAVLSYDHMRHLAATHGEEGWRSAVWPLSVDGLLVVALVTLRQRRHRGEPAGGAWAALTASLAASLAANIAAAEPTPVGWFIGAWPPVALLTVELMLGSRRRQRRRRAP